MEEHHDDIVIGSRFVTEKKPHSLRMMGNNLLQAVICLVTGGAKYPRYDFGYAFV